jgi:hypothetical protein
VQRCGDTQRTAGPHLLIVNRAIADLSIEEIPENVILLPIKYGLAQVHVFGVTIHDGVDVILVELVHAGAEADQGLACSNAGEKGDLAAIMPGCEGVHGVLIEHPVIFRGKAYRPFGLGSDPGAASIPLDVSAGDAQDVLCRHERHGKPEHVDPVLAPVFVHEIDHFVGDQFFIAENDVDLLALQPAFDHHFAHEVERGERILPAGKHHHNGVEDIEYVVDAPARLREDIGINENLDSGHYQSVSLETADWSSHSS